MPRRPKMSRDHNAGSRVNPHDHTNVAVKPYKNNPRTVWIIQHTPGASYIPSFLTGVAAVAHELPSTEPSMGMGAMLSATRGFVSPGEEDEQETKSHIWNHDSATLSLENSWGSRISEIGEDLALSALNLRDSPMWCAA